MPRMNIYPVKSYEIALKSLLTCKA